MVIIFILGNILFWWLIAAAFLLWGARLVNIERRTFGRALATILIGAIAWGLVQALFVAVPPVGAAAGILCGICVSSVVMMAIFDTTFPKAFVANLLAWLLPPVVAGALALLGFAFFGILILLAR